MLNKIEKTIQGKGENGEAVDIEYVTEQFPAMQGMRLAVALAKTFGGGIGEAASGDMKSVMDMDVSKVVQAILANLDEDATPQLVVKLLSRTQRNGVVLTEEAIDKCFAANYGEMLVALQLVLEANFGGFMEALAQGNTGS